jgi:hypothetical protein
MTIETLEQRLTRDGIDSWDTTAMWVMGMVDIGRRGERCGLFRRGFSARSHDNYKCDYWSAEAMS